jgi:Fe2+ or Zn2+ uptake regulation protein
VIKAMLEETGYLSPAEVYAQARIFHPGIGLVTVYRTLDLLAQIGLVRRIHTDGGCHRFASASHGHHHHLVCRHCGETVEFEGCDLSPFLARLSHETGYLIEDHLLELLGACAACQQQV